ncbi:MAG: aldo/keto reductase [Gammaproteobacteria bacterium]|nr:aldo/keto reductase [Gammaproteobacteria bacterium]
MISRRGFIQLSAAASIAGCMPLNGAQNRLPTRLIPGTNEALPIIGLGNSSVFRENNLDPTRRLIDILMEHGGAYVDCGGSSRFSVARVVGERNAMDDTFLGMYFDLDNEVAARKIITELRDIQGATSLDLIQTRMIQGIATHGDILRRWKDDGLTRYIGIARSGKQFYAPMMKLMEARSIDFIQVNYSMLEPEAEERLLPLAMDKGIAIVINRPFINGEYFSVVRGHELPAWADEFDCASWAQFSLKFILSHPAVNCVLTETSNPTHAVDNLGAGFGRLPDEKTRQRMRTHLLNL